MINLNILSKKPKKLSIKFYLRRDISPIVYTQYGSKDIYYHLYIEFIYRRKINKCKSRYFQFVPNDSYVYSFIKGFEDSGLKGYNIYGVKESVFTDDVYAIINSDVDLNPRKYDYEPFEKERTPHITAPNVHRIVTWFDSVTAWILTEIITTSPRNFVAAFLA